MLAPILLFSLLATAVLTDLRSRIIPNLLVAVGLTLGLLLAFLGLNADVTLVDALLGATVGLLLFLPVYLIGKMGAGDVKLLAMCGAFLGAESTLMACLCAMLVGGIYALIWKKLLATFPIKDKRYPYAAAIATGAALAPFVQFT